MNSLCQLQIPVFVFVFLFFFATGLSSLEDLNSALYRVLPRRAMLKIPRYMHYLWSSVIKKVLSFRASFGENPHCLTENFVPSECSQKSRFPPLYQAFIPSSLVQVQLHTLFQQYQDLASSCSEVARERDRHRAEVQLLREELHR